MATEARISAPVLRRWRASRSASVAGLVALSMSNVWPPAMPPAPAAAARQLYPAAHHGGFGRRRGEGGEGRRLQRIPGEDADGFAKAGMHGWLAAPQRVVVHGRQVVMDEGRRMDELHRGGGMIQRRRRGTGNRAGGMHQPWPNALAAAQDGMAHRFGQCRRRRLRRQQAGQGVVYAGAVVHGVCGAGRPCSLTELGGRGRGVGGRRRRFSHPSASPPRRGAPRAPTPRCSKRW